MDGVGHTYRITRQARNTRLRTQAIIDINDDQRLSRRRRRRRFLLLPRFFRMLISIPSPHRLQPIVLLPSKFILDVPPTPAKLFLHIIIIMIIMTPLPPLTISPLRRPPPRPLSFMLSIPSLQPPVPLVFISVSRFLLPFESTV